MNKFTKVTVIIALVCAVLGIVLMGIGAIGGGTQIVDKMASEGLLNFGPDDVDWIERIEGFNIDVNVGSGVQFNEDYEIFTAGQHKFKASVEEVENFVFRLTAGEVDIKEKDCDQWEIEIDGVGEFQTYVEDGTLYVVGEQSGILGDLGDVNITVPRGEKLNSAVFDFGAGDMTLEDLEADMLEVSAGAANVEITAVDAANMNLSVGAGNVEVENSTVGNLEVSVGMGNIEVAGTITGNIDGSVSMGELDIDVYGSTQTEHNYDVSCAAGEVRIGSTSYAGVGNDRKIDNGASTTYTLDCAMGLIDVSFE